MKDIVICCSAAMATSSMIETFVTALLEKNHIEARIKKCTTAEVNGVVKDHHVDLIIPNGNFVCEGVPVISGLPYLTGIGIEKMEKEIIDILTKE